MQKHDELLSKIIDADLRLSRLCELNVIEQVVNVSETTIVQHAWESRQELSVHGWIYGLHNGLLNDLNICITNNNELPAIYQSALSTL
jgi:carbonic anhydrase